MGVFGSTSAGGQRVAATDAEGPAGWAGAGADDMVTARARPREATAPAARLTPVTGTE